ncbi:MAG: hypothetical protein PHR35_01710 [Kiritimatiellae bacterium]|nr:hypothetical protein [Kiritimatiellia bacterium]
MRKASYKGLYCEGEGDEAFLRLIDESFAFLHPNPTVPNIAMLCQPEWGTFVEGAGWGAWWIQNSYGFSYAATPFLAQPWFSMLQRSWDLFWDNQGDGRRMSLHRGSPTATPQSSLVAPDGCLGDCARPGEIVFKQGDGLPEDHDWFYEATAAGVVMQAEILLRSRDAAAAVRYLPGMTRACDFIERAKDPKNNLFLVGPACNLLAPSYGGAKMPDGTFGKGYLAGLSITYLAALDRMVELCRLVGDGALCAVYECRQRLTRDSLALLLTDEGYFVKSVEPDGTKHGVLGQRLFGYLEGVANVDAVALRVVDEQTAETIYNRIASFAEIRPFDFLLTNAPGLDDTYWNWGHVTGGEVPGRPEVGIYGVREFGAWVNGGAWGTVEGRAILAYFRLGKFADAYRSATRAMKWAKDFRMDAPWSQRGENTNNIWSDGGGNQVAGVAVMVDNFAIPAATVRGLFDYEYRADRLILRPRVPGSIARYVQKVPVRFGAKSIRIACINNGPEIRSVTVNGRELDVKTQDRIDLLYEDLPDEATVEITTAGGAQEQAYAPYPVTPALVAPAERKNARADLPSSLREPHAALSALQQRLKTKPAQDYERTLVDAALSCIDACRVRAAMDPGPGYYRAITPARAKGIADFYEKTALNLYSMAKAF